MKRITALLVGVIFLFGLATVTVAEGYYDLLDSVLVAFAGQYSNDDLEKAIIESGFTLYGYEPQDYYNNGTTVFPQISEDGSFWSGSMRALYEAYSAYKIDNYYRVDFIGKNAIVENQVLALYLVPENVSGPDGSISNKKRIFTPLNGNGYSINRPYYENWWLINNISTIWESKKSELGNVAFNIVNTSDFITVIPNAGTGGLDTQWGKFGKTYWFNGGGGLNPLDAHNMNLYIKYISNLSNAQFPTASKILVNEKEVVFDAYNIGGNNFFKLRDLAFILNGTEKQFSVGWNEVSNSITLTSGESYSAVGGEMTGKGTGSIIPTWSDSKISLNGNETSFTAYNLDGNNYFKLRDIGAALNFAVEWDGARNTIVIDTSRGYTAE